MGLGLYTFSFFSSGKSILSTCDTAQLVGCDLSIFVDFSFLMVMLIPSLLFIFDVLVRSYLFFCSYYSNLHLEASHSKMMNLSFSSFVLFQPPTEKLHQIMARTAIFVSKHGGQSEIVLRVKQGDNPTFGFLMPDHQLHSYFRFLVDHPEVLNKDHERKSQDENVADGEPYGGGGALSLLGSLYGAGEDEDGAAETTKENLSTEDGNVGAPVAHAPGKVASPKCTSVKDGSVSNHIVMPKDKAPVVRRNSSINGLKAGSSSSTRKEGESLHSVSAVTDKSRASSMPPMAKVEPLFVEPPSEIKKLVNKIVEFIIKNGKQFEAVLIEQDSEHGRFPFLLSSNQYNPYYLKVLQEAQKVHSLHCLLL